jgi:pSer/pThr/pTyr-binding forkhead associated (FHA) protein
MNIPEACFIEFLNSDRAGKKIELVNQRTILGRHPSCTIPLGNNDLRVSNRHAAIFIDESAIFIEDLGSTNHVYVNNVLITKTELKHNDIVRFGSNGPEFRFIKEVNEIITEKPLQASGPLHHQITESEPIEVGEKVQPDIQNDNSLFDVSPDTENHDLFSSNEHNKLPNARKKDAPTALQSEIKPDPMEDQSLFDVSPDTENRDLHFSSENVPPVKAVAKHTPDPDTISSEMNDDEIFDISPGSESAVFKTPINVSNTMEISARLQKQMMSTQDIDHLAKNPKTRIKILNDKNIGDQQKQIISTVTRAYSSMRRKYFIVFGVIISFLCIGIIWFAHGYFSYKDQLSKARALKDQIASFDDQFEKARQQEGGESNNLEMLYNKLQKVQSQFDSVRAKLELKDQRKIYSDTVEVFLDAVMNELNEKNYSIPQHMLERVKYYIDMFTTSKRRSTEILMQRRTNYFTEIEQIFSQKNVPPILAYVAMQESMLDTNITSSAGAAGMWQFMESTGRRFNLTINNTTDERTDWRKSTVAAANYFRSLLLLFGDGRGALLAMAAYNAGEEKIKKALDNVENPIRDRDFWYLYRTSSILAVETREYVPQVLARIIIDRHPSLYGF